jgi:RHS repeat-associated protein
VEMEDPLHNRTTVGLRDAAGNLMRNGNDYRVLAPALLSDPNRNQTAVEFDALGRVVKTAVLGKEGVGEGDTLADPTTRLEYHLHCWKSRGKPVFVHTLAREKHGAANPRWQEAFSYSDGFGREVMKKVQAEPGLVPVLDAHGRPLRNPDGSLQLRHEPHRWVGTGRTVFDNKGNPVKKYEPFFSGTSGYEDEKALAEWGVTPVLRYDPLGRLVRTDLPNGTQTRVVFDAWHQETWDENDTVAGTSWLARKQAGTPAERRCANLALAHAGTPTVAHLDSLGRVFLSVADNGPGGLRPTRAELDVEGNQRSVTDARGNLILRQVFDMVSRPVRVVHADAGPWDTSQQRRAVPVALDPDGARTLLDAADKPIRSWNERGHAFRHQYDELQRPTHLFVREGAGVEKLVERTVYGETHPLAEARNLRARAHQTYDGAGVLTNARFDFKGNLLEGTRCLAREYRDCPDWSPLGGLTSVSAIEAVAGPLLESETFTTTTAYDALNRVTSQTTPDGSETRPAYNEANLLEKLEARIRGAATWTTFVEDIGYNPRGQRERVACGNGTVTEYTYDGETFRLIRLRTTRTADHALLQELRYETDPVGNIVAMEDGVSYGNPAVSARGLYEYDALYQLVSAEGREHPGQQPAGDEPAPLRVDHPNDLRALRRYRESYAYDRAGNIERMVHQPLQEDGTGWTRRYAYASDSNRLLGTSAPRDAPGVLSASYGHDEAGNMVRMPHLAELRWDHANRLQSVRKQVQNPSSPVNDVYFKYDSSGQRVLKRYEHGGLIEERIYLGGYEVYRKRPAGAVQPTLERQTLHVMDDQRCVALVETKTLDASVPGFVATTRQRFQLDNHLGSSVVELDGEGAVITYEEYHPYGGTSFHAARAGVEASARRYRYTGKERDEETGLYYHGARYYAPWLGRWVSCDPLPQATNLYCGIDNNPVNKLDPDGKAGEAALTAVPAPSPGAAPGASPSTNPFRLIQGEGLGNRVPQGSLRLVPNGGTGTGVGATLSRLGASLARLGAVAPEVLVPVLAPIAAAGGVAVAYETIEAAREGRKTPVEVADEFYGTRFGDLVGWGQDFVGWARGVYSKMEKALAEVPGAKPEAQHGSEPRPIAPEQKPQFVPQEKSDLDVSASKKDYRKNQVPITIEDPWAEEGEALQPGGGSGNSCDSAPFPRCDDLDPRLRHASRAEAFAEAVSRSAAGKGTEWTQGPGGSSRPSDKVRFGEGTHETWYSKDGKGKFSLGSQKCCEVIPGQVLPNFPNRWGVLNVQ